MVDSQVDNKGVVLDLTNSEKEVLNLLTEERLSPKKIALQRKCTRQAISKIIKSLKKKGAYTLSLQVVDKDGGTQQPSVQLRIHALQFIIKILWKDERYAKQLESSNQLKIDGNTLDLYPNAIYLSLNQSFYGDTLSHAFWKVSQYMPRLLARMEHELKCILIKARSQNIKLVRIHIAETNNELAKQVENTGDRYFKVYAEDDGKLRFLIDNSFNLHEFEGVRAISARPDMEKVGNVFNDIADKEHYLPSDTKSMIDKLAIISQNMVTGIVPALNELKETQRAFSRDFQVHVPVMREMGRSAKETQKTMKQMYNLLSQKKLGEYL